MDQNSTNGTGIDKRNWRERLGIGTRDMPKISDEFKPPPATPAAPKLVVRAPQPVTRPAPMAPRPGSVKPAAAEPAASEIRRAPEPQVSDALAEKLRAQRAAAEKLAEQRVSAARERAEARSTTEPSLAIPRSPPADTDQKPVQLAASRPKFSFAEDEIAPPRRELGIATDVNRPKLQRPATSGAGAGPLLPPRPALGGDRMQPRTPAPSLRPDAPPSYRPIDPATGYPQPVSRQASAAGQRPYAAEPASLSYGTRLPPRAPAYEPPRRAPIGNPPSEGDGYGEELRGDPRLGRAAAPRGRNRPVEEEPDEVFEDEAPPQAARRRASASEYNSAYREAEEGFEEDHRRSNGPWLLLLGLLVAAVATAGVVWFYNTKMKTTATATPAATTTESVPVIAPPELPAKTAVEAPAEATGDAAAVSKKQIYDRIVGDQEVSGEQMVPSEVTPVQPEVQQPEQSGTGQIPQPSGTTGQGTDDPLPLPLPPPPGDSNTQGQLDQGTDQQVAAAAEPLVNEAKSQPEGQGGESIASLLPPTESDEGTAGNAQASPPSTDKPAAEASETISDPATSVSAEPEAKPAAPVKKKTAATKTATKRKKAATDTTASSGAEPLVIVPPADVASPSQQTAETATAPAAQTGQPPVRKKKTIFDLFKRTTDSPAQDAAAREKVVNVEPAPQDAAAATTVASLPASKPDASTASGGGGGYVVQLASFRSQSDAQAEYGRLKAKYPSIIGPHPARISQASVGGSTRYRLGLGPLTTRDQASQICGNLFAAGERDCLVRTQ
jgi:cell division septation protein DedD